MSGTNINGVINVYKEKGYTSHDVVAKLRGILKTKKIGHTGTLDPNAEGVLPVCIGNATKLCELIMEKEKEYTAELILGRQTDTQDISGEVLNQSEQYAELSAEQIENTIMGFIGEYNQVPPMYSAVKVNGKRLYELARKGVEVERKSRKVYIHKIKIESVKLPVIKINVCCSKGTYIRTLCDDIGMRLGVYACMGELLRTRTGKFEIKDSLKLAQIEEIVKSGKLTESGILIGTDKVIDNYPALYIRDEFEKLLYNGNKLAWDMFDDGNEKKDGMMVRVYDSSEKFTAVYRYDEKEDMLKPEKMFRQNIQAADNSF